MFNANNTTEEVITINQIEAMTEQDAQAAALETMRIKGHDIYFIDFGGYFQYSALVFFDGSHIRYADEYELHHPNHTRDELRAMYIAALNRKLFTDAELILPPVDYATSKARHEYLRNYYGLRRPYISVFRADPNEQRRTANMTYDPISFAYYDDKAFVDQHVALFDACISAEESAYQDYAFMKTAFKYEMANHEYAINWQANWDTLSAFYNLKYHDPDEDIEYYFDQLHLSNDLRRAYLDARREYIADNSDNY